jgi:protein-tyrosine phosphatase
MKILMVCLGNICRSPLAEGVMRKKIEQSGLNWEVDSAGTLDFHVGSAPFHLSQQVALQHGIDISQLKARSFSASDFNTFDLIYAMANDVMYGVRAISGDQFDEKKAILFLEEIHPGKYFDLKDPYHGTTEDFEEVYKLIDQTCDQIIEKYSKAKS